jgi:hypothetical protein
MNPGRFDRWIGLGANVGVVLGLFLLILLILQLNQNRSMMRAQTRNEIAMGGVSLLSMPSNNAQLAGVLQRADSGGQLTPEEYVQYRRYLIATYRYYENAYYQYRHGLYDEAEYTTQKVAWRNYVSRSAASVAIWCDMRPSFSPEFAREMDSLIPRKC